MMGITVVGEWALTFTAAARVRAPKHTLSASTTHARHAACCVAVWTVGNVSCVWWISALPLSSDLLGVLWTNCKFNVAFRVCVVDFCAAAQFYIVPRTGVFTTYARLNTGLLRLQRGHPTATLFDQSWTEMSNSNFASIVPSSTRIRSVPCYGAVS